MSVGEMVWWALWWSVVVGVLVGFTLDAIRANAARRAPAAHQRGNTDLVRPLLAGLVAGLILVGGVIVGAHLISRLSDPAQTAPTPVWTCEPSPDGLHERCWLNGWDD